jgi:hypothetical protein
VLNGPMFDLLRVINGSLHSFGSKTINELDFGLFRVHNWSLRTTFISRCGPYEQRNW